MILKLESGLAVPFYSIDHWEVTDEGVRIFTQKNKILVRGLKEKELIELIKEGTSFLNTNGNALAMLDKYSEKIEQSLQECSDMMDKAAKAADLSEQVLQSCDTRITNFIRDHTDQMQKLETLNRKLESIINDA